MSAMTSLKNGHVAKHSHAFIGYLATDLPPAAPLKRRQNAYSTIAQLLPHSNATIPPFRRDIGGIIDRFVINGAHSHRKMLNEYGGKV
jgi:hypothetical protein